jgi:cysteinyl-tRNA synthetase
MSILHANTGDALKKMGEILGILQQDPKQWFQGGSAETVGGDADIQVLIDTRIAAKKAKNWAEADKIRGVLKAKGILLEDKPDGTTDWRRE